MYCGKCCKKSRGRETFCSHCGHRLCSDPVVDVGNRYKNVTPEEAEQPLSEAKTQPNTPAKPDKPGKSDKPDKLRYASVNTGKIRRKHVFRPSARLRKLLDGEPVKLSLKDYAMLLVPFLLIAVELFLFFSVGPIILKKLNLEDAAYKLLNLEQVFFKQGDLEKQIVGLWESDFEKSLDLKPSNFDFTKSQIMFTKEKTIKVAIENEKGGLPSVRVLEGPYTLKNMMLTARLTSPDDVGNPEKISCVIEMDGNVLRIVWVSGFPLNHESDRVETTYRRVNTEQSLFDNKND